MFELLQKFGGSRGKEIIVVEEVARGRFFVLKRLEGKIECFAYLRNLFGFFSAGFRIWNEHNKLSSTLIIAPALSNSPQ